MQHATECHVEPVAERANSQARARSTVQYLSVAGMGCPKCANRVRNTLLGRPGVVDVEVDVAAGLATVWYEKAGVTVGEMVDLVAASGRGTHHRYLAVPITSRF